ncbi:hypothetical protein [Croceiramulus getboli]|nr:hypothetical protein P8624_09280 [Flavobacteriaceae bacterium YJPT1-3]
MLPDFKLKPEGPLSKMLISRGDSSYLQVVDRIARLPYGRNTNPADYASLLEQGHGSCTTKHAFLKAVADENGFTSISLNLGIYKMTTDNTPHVGPILNKYGLDFLFEAHVYLRHDDEIYDFTFPDTTDVLWEEDLFTEFDIQPNQITDYKRDTHQYFLREWIKRDTVPHDYTTLWSIREECIQAIEEGAMAH